VDIKLTHSSDLKKLETDLVDGNTNKMDSDLDTPKDQQEANGENPPKSDILEDDPNLKDKELDNFKKYEDDVDASTRKKMEDDADGEVKKGKKPPLLPNRYLTSFITL
jgi:hypothetical protein